MDREQEIIKKLSTPPLSERLQECFGNEVIIDQNNLKCIKDTSRSSIWKLLLKSKEIEYPIILKVYYSPDKYKNRVELNFLTKGYSLLQEFMPKIYFTESNIDAGNTWVLMEYVEQLRGQITMEPNYFTKIIPGIAKLHAYTFEERISIDNEMKQWLPFYQSNLMIEKRRLNIKKTREYLDNAMKNDRLQKIVKPYYKIIRILLKKEPDLFQELLKEGQCIIHGDLHMQNICCNNTNEDEWNIKLIDWETAKVGSGWIDLIVLVEVLIDFRMDWQENAEEIRTKCVELYTQEMFKYGIEFQHDPLMLYKMAYLQRTLEKGIYNQLRRELENRPGKLLETYLKKVTLWGQELKLY